MAMEIKISKRIQSLGGYAFDEVDKLVEALKKQGVDPIDFGVGDPLDETPEFVRAALKKSADKYAGAGYPSYIGSSVFRNACAAWFKKRFGVDLDPDKEICSSIGSKEAIFNFPEAFIDPGDVVVIPSPGYPPFKTGTIFAEGTPYYVPLLEENNFLLDFEAVPEVIARKAKIIWINYPNSPTGTCAPLEYYRKLIAWAKKFEIIVAADEGCYIDLYFDEKPPSILEAGKGGVVAFYSLSKRNNMTGYRVGFVVGDEKIVSAFKKLKTNIDSGTPNFVQEAAIAALEDENHVAQMREKYKMKHDIMQEAFARAGLPTRKSQATFYIWQKAPKGMDSVAFAKRLLERDLAIVTTPGSWISEPCESGMNPGENYVRFALVPSIELCREAAQRIVENLKV